MSDKIREEFEKWSFGTYDFTIMIHGTYKDLKTQASFNKFNAGYQARQSEIDDISNALADCNTDLEHEKIKNKDLRCHLEKIKENYTAMHTAPHVLSKYLTASNGLAVLIRSSPTSGSLSAIKREAMLEAADIIDDQMGARSFNNSTGKNALDSAIRNIKARAEAIK